jgi:hypothetical protein
VGRPDDKQRGPSVPLVVFCQELCLITPMTTTKNPGFTWIFFVTPSEPVPTSLPTDFRRENHILGVMCLHGITYLE